MDSKLCLETAIRGERERGTDGVVWYDLNTRTITYLLSSEVEPSELRESVSDLLTEEGDTFFFVLVKQGEKVDIAKVNKLNAMRDL